MAWTNLPVAVPCKRAGYTFYACPDWKPTESTVLRALRKGVKECKTVVPDKPQLIDLLDAWVAGKKEHSPTTMVVKGHYRAMIDDPDMNFIGLWSDNCLIASMGYTVEGGKACVGFAKHLYGTWWVSKYMWASVVGELCVQTGQVVTCGDTADRLKRELGFEPVRQYKVTWTP